MNVSFSQSESGCVGGQLLEARFLNGKRVFLTHPVNEELEEVNENCVRDLNPAQRIP